MGPVSNFIKDQKDIATTFNYIYEYLYDQPAGTVHTKSLFDQWAAAKKRFYNAWGGQLSVRSTVKISFDLSQREREQRVGEFVAHIYDDVCCDLGEFLDHNRAGILKNELIEDTYRDLCGHDHSFPKNIKLSRALMQLATKEHLCSEEEADYARCRIAELIQETKVTGWLCLSVHPLDYLSLSENQANWRSCHALDGEYASGNLSYMIDNYTIIAYLCSDENEVLPRFPEDVPWNNKKWRMLLCCDDVHKLIWASRQYPFYSKSALDALAIVLGSHENDWKFFDSNFEPEVIPWLDAEDKYKFISSSFKHFYKTKDKEPNVCFELEEPWFYYSGEMCPVSSLVHNVSDSFNYNDLTNSSTYVPDTLFYGTHTLHLTHRGHYAPKAILLGGVPNCIFCDDQPIAYTAVPLCPDCLIKSGINSEYTTKCTKCGKRILTDGALYIHGEPYCTDCWREVVD